jgi:hypothetical protein
VVIQQFTSLPVSQFGQLSFLPLDPPETIRESSQVQRHLILEALLVRPAAV